MRAGSISIHEAEAVLELDTSPYTADDLSRAYRAKAKASHPDMGGTTEQMSLVNQANDRLVPLFEGKPEGYVRKPASPDDSGYTRINDDIGISDEDIIEVVMAWQAAVNANKKATDVSDDETQADAADEPDEEDDASTESEEPSSTSRSSFSYRFARVIWALRRLPYGLATFVFLEFEALTKERPMNDMFDSIPNMADLFFETAIFAPFWGITVRLLVRAVIGWICEKIAGKNFNKQL